VFGFDFEAIAVNVDDADAVADGGRAAAGGPFAVAEADAATVGIHRLGNGDDLTEKALFGSVKFWVRGVIVARRVEASAANLDGQECEYRECRELKNNAEAYHQGKQASQDGGCADENQRKAGRDHFCDQQDDPADQPQPRRIDV